VIMVYSIRIVMVVIVSVLVCLCGLCVVVVCGGLGCRLNYLWVGRLSGLGVVVLILVVMGVWFMRCGFLG